MTSIHPAFSSTRNASNVVGFPAPRQVIAPRVTVVVPCYNEAKRLDTDAFVRFLDRVQTVDLVFVNDGSKDATLERLEEISSAQPQRVHVLSLTRNSGKAEAVRQGLLYAAGTGADFVGYWDADLATPLDAIEDFARIGQRYEDVDVIFGARRMMTGHRVYRTPGRRVISRICATLARVAVRLPISDTQCGAKLLRNSDALTEALAKPFTAGWLFDVELFTRLSARFEDRSRAFYELPLSEWTEVAGSKVSGRAVMRSGLSMLRLIGESRLGLPRAEARIDVPGVDVLFTPVAPLAKAA